MKIHLLSDSKKMNSGYSIVTKNIAIGLKKLGHNVSTTGLQTAYNVEYFDDNNGGGEKERIEVLPIQSDKADDVGQFMNNLQNVSPDICIFIGDMDMDLNPLAKVFPGTWVYTPVNGKDMPFGIVSDLNGVVKKGGKVIAMCKYGLAEMKMAGVNTDGYIYHGYNDKVFRKIDVKDITDVKSAEIVSILKWDSENKRWVQNNAGIDKIGDILGYGKRFIYLHVGQNVGIRKRQERLLRAYAIMIKDSKQLRDRTHLHMHCLPISGRGLNLIEVAMKLGIQDNISFSYGSYLSAGWSEEAVNVLYNLADVHVSASSSEGFGLPTIESMSCGLPNIAPDCTSFTELIGNDVEESKNRGLLAKISDWQYEPIGRFKPLVSQEHLATLMKKIYVDEKLRQKLGDNGIEWVEQFSWDKVCEQWNNVLKSM
jgi:glycosyltransferase involved in cell wall biosynthesis